MNKVRRATDSVLLRDDFREGVFARDHHKCVICGEPGQDAHHILERRLFSNGGYFLSNGATLCGKHHIEAEKTTLTVDEIRQAAGIIAPALPEHFYPDTRYDKWGNPMLANGTRTKGELFHDGSVQKILHSAGVLGEFSDYVKYPRTFHLPWSPGASSDDRILSDLSGFEDAEVVVTEKMDGENTSIYPNYFHARSLDSSSHPSQGWARAFAAKIGYNIPAGWRLCVENLYAKHSISYPDLESYVQAFSVWNEKNQCLSWDDTLEWCELIGVKTVKVLYRGIWDEQLIKGLYDPKGNMEGYVVRPARGFAFTEFGRVVGKYVRAGHVQSAHNWKSQPVIPNGMRG